LLGYSKPGLDPDLYVAMLWAGGAVIAQRPVFAQMLDLATRVLMFRPVCPGEALALVGVSRIH